jgi:ribosomal-protein-alanine N-acetyltransferase
VGSQKKKIGHKNQVTVRPAKPEDLHYIRSLGKKVFQQYGPYEEMLVGWFESGFTITFLALTERRPVGFAMLSGQKGIWYLPRVSELLAIAVEPEKWKLGIGDLLMKEVQRKAEAEGVEMLILHTAVENLPGQKLFKKYGFVPLDIKKNFYPEGQDALMMYKDIA